ncbi:MAG: hypothetical protein KDA21_07210, partial [Phycisphaerales bacterium]|nr:hypothetical protein [Phycisphaerales bacterium]
MRLSLPRDEFIKAAGAALSGAPAAARTYVPLAVRLLSDQLTPVLAYRRLVAEDARPAPSFLLESVEGGERQGRHSILGTHPVLEIRARGSDVEVVDHRSGQREQREHADPMQVLKDHSRRLRLAPVDERLTTFALPTCFLGGWIGHASYDTVRYAEPDKLPFAAAPHDDRGLPDLHFGLYDEVVIFDHVSRLVFVIRLVELSAATNAGSAWDHASSQLVRTAEALQRHSKPLPSGYFEMPGGVEIPASNLTRAQHRAMVDRAKEYIRAGDIFQ